MLTLRSRDEGLTDSAGILAGHASDYDGLTGFTAIRAERRGTLGNNMMRLWLSKNSAASLREQLGTQLTLGVISGDLKPGEKLPSVRELARRYKIHSNTVSAAYRDVEARGWLKVRKGSGVYVQSTRQTTEKSSLDG